MLCSYGPLIQAFFEDIATRSMVGSACITWLATAPLGRDGDVDQTTGFVPNRVSRVIKWVSAVGLTLVWSALRRDRVRERCRSVNGNTGATATTIQTIATIVPVAVARNRVVAGRVHVARSGREANVAHSGEIDVEVAWSVAVRANVEDSLFRYHIELILKRSICSSVGIVRD